MNITAMQEMTRDSQISVVFAELYEEFMPKIYRYISYKVNNVQLTEDLTSTVFEKALDNFEKYSRNKAAFSTWIFSIARNTLIDFYRTNGKHRTEPLDDSFDLVSEEASPGEVLEKREEQDYLRRCLSTLPADEQEIIQMKFASEFNNREIAKILGLSESNVGVKLFRSLKKLGEVFKESYNG